VHTLTRLGQSRQFCEGMTFKSKTNKALSFDVIRPVAHSVPWLSSYHHAVSIFRPDTTVVKGPPNVGRTAQAPLDFLCSRLVRTLTSSSQHTTNRMRRVLTIFLAFVESSRMLAETHSHKAWHSSSSIKWMDIGASSPSQIPRELLSLPVSSALI